MRNQTRPGLSKRQAAGSDASLVSFLLSARLQDVSVPMLQCSILPVHHQEEHPRGHQAALRGGHQRDPSHHCRDLQNVPRREFARSVVPDPPSVLTVLCVYVCVCPTRTCRTPNHSSRNALWLETAASSRTANAGRKSTRLILCSGTSAQRLILDSRKRFSEAVRCPQVQHSTDQREVLGRRRHENRSGVD